MTFHNYLNYIATNENIDAIIKGLDVNNNDKVLSILGSGDQAFAMLEHSKVIATDTIRAQLKFVNKRIEYLKENNFQDFLMKNYSVKKTREYIEGVITRTGEYVLEFINLRNNYFLKEGRLENIKDNLDNLKIFNKNIIDCHNEEFNKIYFSNALRAGTNITELVDKLPHNGLIYLSNNKVANSIIEYSDKYSVVKDYELSNIACELEKTSYEKPGVYRKIVKKN